MTRSFFGAAIAVACAAWAAASGAAEPISPGGIRTGIFGLEATGHRFVYVFDRSASMSEPGGRPLARAKQELLESLDALGDVQQFYIVFYNQRQHVFSPSGMRGRLVFATEENKRAARRFVESVRADGGTRHFEAIQTGLRLGPDAMFILTDGDRGDDLASDELETLSRGLGGTKCLVVQFGGDAARRSPNLARLAEMSGGTYRVVDAP